MFCYNLSEVCHFLEQLGKELRGLGMVHLELELQGLQQVVLYVLNGLHVQQTRAVWGSRRTGGSVIKFSGPTSEAYSAKLLTHLFLGLICFGFKIRLEERVSNSKQEVHTGGWNESEPFPEAFFSWPGLNLCNQLI